MCLADTSVAAAASVASTPPVPKPLPKAYDPFTKATLPAGVWRKPVVVEKPASKPAVPAPAPDPFSYWGGSFASDSSNLSSPSVDSYTSGGGGDFGGGGASGSWD